MKRFFIITIVILGSIITVGCSEEIAHDVFVQRTPVNVTASVTSQESSLTRAVANLNTNEGFTLSTTDDYNKVNVNIDGDDYVYSITGADGATTGTKLDIVGTQPYFPVGETSVNVYARYPDYSGDVIKDGETTYFTIQQDQTTTDAYLRSDLMTAAATATRTLAANGNWNVTEAALVFQHQMSKIVINASSEDESIITIKNVVINNVKPRVPLTIGNSGYEVGVATTSASGTTYDVQVLEAVTGTGTGAVIIPAQEFAPTGGATQCTFATITVDFKNPYNNNVSEEVNLSYYFTGTGKTFEANKVYTMNVVVGIDNIKLYDGEVTENAVDISAWNDADATTINIFPTVVHTSLRMEGRILLNNTKVTNSEDASLLSKTYTGSMITLSTEELKVQSFVSETWVDLTIDQNYVATYEDNVDAGTAKVTVVGIGQYSGTLEASFTITKRSLSDVTIDNIPSETYDGYVHRPAVTITEDIDGDGINEKTLFLDTDFTLTYPNDLTTAGSKNITITGINNYSGTTTKTFEITKATGSYSFADNAVRYYVPVNKTQTYTNALTITRGDADVTVTGTTDNAAVTVATGGLVSITPTSNVNTAVTVTMTLTSTNYTYQDYQYTINLKSGPILPLMYVAPYNLGQPQNGKPVMNSNNWTTSSAKYSATETYYGGNDYNWEYLRKNGVTRDGIHYHIPSYAEWLSIITVGGGINWGTEVTKTSQSESGISFGMTNSNLTGDSNGNGSNAYTYSVSNQTYTSDYYSNGSGTAYAIRFKGSEYCCAYRYDNMETDDNNIALTGNSYGKISTVIRAIYLGSSTSETITSIQKLDWKNESDYTIALPALGPSAFGGEVGHAAYGSELSSYYRCAESNNTIIFRDQTGGSVRRGSNQTDGYMVRLFRDAY